MNNKGIALVMSLLDEEISKLQLEAIRLNAEIAEKRQFRKWILESSLNDPKTVPPDEELD